MADFNAKLRKGREEKVVGIHGQGIRNMRGEKRVEWSSTNNLISGINMFLVNNKKKKEMVMERAQERKTETRSITSRFAKNHLDMSFSRQIPNLEQTVIVVML